MGFASAGNFLEEDSALGIRITLIWYCSSTTVSEREEKRNEAAEQYLENPDN